MSNRNRTQNLLSVEFAKYRKRVIPVDAPDVQVTECRRAFMAGSLAMLEEIAKITYANPNCRVPELDEMLAEMQEFVKAVKAGRA